MFATILIAALAGETAAQAQDAEWTVSGATGVVSDYRYRGLSLSGGNPALQAEITLEHATGFYASAYASSIEEYGIGPDGDGARTEFTLVSGWSGEWAGLEIDAAVSWFVYPDGSDVNYYEIPVEVARSVGDTRFSAGIAYAPSQTALGDEDNWYSWLGIDYSPTDWPLGLTAEIGREEGAWAPTGKTDWTVGVEAPLGPAILGLAWTDSNVESGKLVASAFLRF